jgi:hypothetical protein
LTPCGRASCGVLHLGARRLAVVAAAEDDDEGGGESLAADEL